MDRFVLLLYAEHMLDGTKIFASDAVWRAMLADMGAQIVDNTADADVVFDDITPGAPVTAMELKSIVLAAANNDNIIRRVCGEGVVLSPGLARVVVALYKSGGAAADELKIKLGYSRDAATHTIEAAIYQLRRQFGRDFIQNIGGVYKLGKL